jgi:N-acetyl sugar amidotransferase
MLEQKKIKFCKRCLYSSEHALGITFDDQGICSGCKIHDEKNSLDWKHRLEKIKKIVKPYKSKSRKNYDCIVPVTGANDSYYTVHLVKNVLGLNPLLVSYNKYFNTPLGISNLANLRIQFDSDIIFKNVNMKSVKNITKFGLLEYQNIYWHILAGHTVFPLEAAINYKVPLIIWGAHQGMEQVGMFSHEHEVEMSRRYRHDHDLFGVEADQLVKLENDLKEEDIFQYRYPDDASINSIGVRGIYLGNYFRWDPTAQHKMMVKNYGYKSAKLTRTFDTYDHIDCYNYMNIHDHLKLSKCGYSKITDHVCREIRHNRINREKGKNLIKFYEQKNVENLKLFSEWLDIDINSLNFILNRSKNPKFWMEKDINKFSFKGISTKFKNSNNKIYKDNLDKEFICTDKIELKQSNRSYVLFGKGVE